MSDTQVGEILTESQERDAIHVAVASVIARDRLAPGEHIGFLSSDNQEEVCSLRHSSERVGIGIVDPFLKEPVEDGQRCWMFLYPRTITSLRHSWTHPAFAPAAPIADKLKSEAWMRDFLWSMSGPDYETVIAAAVSGSGFDDYLLIQGDDAHGEIPPEFWDHVEVITGRKCPRRATYFTCSC